MLPASSHQQAHGRVRGDVLARAALRVPLAVKLAGANAVLVLLAAVAVGAVARHGASELRLAAIPAAALVAGIAVNVLLVRAALRPLRVLERTAARVVAGDLGARVPESPLADPEMARVGTALNALLDALGAERERVRSLAAEVIRSSDADRARVARELHDSTAQTLAALTFQAGSAARRVGTAGDTALAEQLDIMRDLSADALEELRSLSLTVHPRVLDDLGLAAALRQLADGHAGVGVEVQVDGDTAGLAPPVAATLYRVAEEAVDNAVSHGEARNVLVRLAVESTRVRLEVTDDGRGFALPARTEQRPGTGLFVMQERAALLDGCVRVESTPGRGTRISAELPLAQTSNASHPEAA
jgi:signal transduction histidine kinase